MPTPVAVRTGASFVGTLARCASSKSVSNAAPAGFALYHPAYTSAGTASQRGVKRWRISSQELPSEDERSACKITRKAVPTERQRLESSCTAGNPAIAYPLSSWPRRAAAGKGDSITYGHKAHCTPVAQTQADEQAERDAAVAAAFGTTEGADSCTGLPPPQVQADRDTETPACDEQARSCIAAGAGLER